MYKLKVCVMQIMKSATIWESASRPLFVRSVWLEATKIGRAGPQRHFILDYEPRRRSAHTKSAASGGRSKVYATLKHSNSYDYASDWHDYDECVGCSDTFPTDLLLIGPAKVAPLPTSTNATQSQVQQSKHAVKSSTCRTQQQRPLIFFRNRAPHHGPLHELYELYSHHSSLQDLQSSLSQAHSHADERLAERVLNWLDLAGKGVQTVQPLQQLDIQEMVKNRQKKTLAAKASAPPQAARISSTANTPNNKTQRAATAQASSKLQPSASTQTRMQSAHTQAQPPTTQPALQPRKQVRYASATRTEQATANIQAASGRQQRSAPTDAVKHITIIFDREGMPVRFNRPVRNIDLCTLSASPGTVRRLAGSLASARLYSEVEPAKTHAAPRIMSSRLRSSVDGAYSTKSTQKRTHDPNVFDAKKQLHIFMPNLPEKNLLTAIGGNDSACGSADDTLSGLSNTFSELCKF